MIKQTPLLYLLMSSLAIAGEILAPVAVDDRAADTSAYRANAESLLSEEYLAADSLELRRINNLEKLWFTESRGRVKDSPQGYFNTPHTTLPTLLFDLGSDREVSAVLIWNFALFTPGEVQTNAAKQIQIQLNSEAEGSETFDGEVYSHELQPPGQNEKSVVVGEVVPISPNVKARYLRLQITENFFDAERPGGDRVGLSRVRVQVED